MITAAYNGPERHSPRQSGMNNFQSRTGSMPALGMKDIGYEESKRAFYDNKTPNMDR